MKIEKETRKPIVPVENVTYVDNDPNHGIDFSWAAICKEYKKLVELICRNEEKLKATMTDEQKELFEKYTDCVLENQIITDCLIFQNSFKLGARMMLEVMEE